MEKENSAFLALGCCQSVTIEVTAWVLLLLTLLKTVKEKSTSQVENSGYLVSSVPFIRQRSFFARAVELNFRNRDEI